MTTQEVANRDAAETALKIAFATMSAVLDLSGRDPLLGAAIVDRLAVLGEGETAGTVALLGVTARCIVERTGVELPSLFRPN